MDSAMLLTLSSRKRPAEYSVVRFAYLPVNQSASSSFVEYDLLLLDLWRNQKANRI